jgi:hypothetical protein
MQNRSIAIAVALTLPGCGATIVPPPAPPARVLPVAQPPRPPTETEGTLLIDADHPAKVEEAVGEVVSYRRRAVEYRTLCPSTPCAVNLSRGPHSLSFDSPDGKLGGTGDVEVSGEPTAYRYALGDKQPNRDAANVGTGVLIASVVAMAIGAGLAKSSDPTTSGQGAAIGLGGLVGLTIGLIIAASSSSVQNGTGVQWSVNGVSGR